MKLLIALLFLFSCGNQPTPVASNFSQGVANGNGLWFATRIGSSGRLQRYDLTEDVLTKLQINRICADTELRPDRDEGVLMLTRMGSDSIQALSGNTGIKNCEIGLPASELHSQFDLSFNPQSAVRDIYGRIWTVGLNSNDILILEPSLQYIMSSISLAHHIKPDSDLYLEPSIILQTSPSEITVFCQRLQRNLNDSWDWIPSAESAMIVIDIDTLMIIKTKYLPVANPIRAFLTSTQETWPEIVLVGAGALNNTPLQGSVATISTKNYTITHLVNYQHKILDAAANDKGEVAFIDWSPQEKSSCLVFEAQKLLCQSGGDYQNGYIFNKIALANEKLFVSQIENGTSKLLRLNLIDGKIEKNYFVRGIIESMIIGP